MVLVGILGRENKISLYISAWFSILGCRICKNPSPLQMGPTGDIVSSSSAHVFGVGEHCHGDLLSWLVRLDVARALVENGRRLVVLTENLDFYVAGLRRKSPRFITHGDAGEFHPFLVHLSNRTREHLDAARELSKLAEGRVYGIDVQALDHPGVKGGQYVRSKMKGLTGPKGDGTLRNQQNAEMILRIVRDHPSHVVLYLAHNEHVALGCKGTERNGTYRTEGDLLRRALGKSGYVSIATYARNHGSFWNEAHEWRVRRDRAKTAPPMLTASRLTVLTRSPKYSLGGDYTTADFDYTIATLAA
jgi:hypothetical protein